MEKFYDAIQESTFDLLIWRKHMNDLILGPYILYTLMKTWKEADKHCRALKGYLATISSQEWNIHLKTQMEIKYVLT